MPSPHRPLDVESHQIRLLSVSAAAGLDEPLRGELDVVSMDDRPQYEALSYVWGKDLAPTPMAIDNINMEITQNLDAALRYLRHHDKARVLWVDAICIDQTNFDERAEQVRQMRDIYYFSSTVVVWLGPPTSDSDIAMDSIADFKKDYWQTLDFQIQFMDILCRPWFTRIWVVQEFVLGQNDPLVGCGYKWVNWLPFITAWAHFADNMRVINEEYSCQYRKDLGETFQHDWRPRDSQGSADSTAVDNLPILSCLRYCFGEDSYLQPTGHSDISELMLDIRQNPDNWKARYAVMRYCQYESPIAKIYWKRLELTEKVPLQYHAFLMHARGIILRKRQFLTFEHILKGTMNLRSTDARDKIYGILGLVNPDARNSIPIDYHKSAAWTFVPTMAYIITHESSGLALLGFLWTARPFKIPFPSWVADFTISALGRDEHSPAFLRGSCANEAWSWPTDTHVSKDLTVFSGSGFCLGKVSKLIGFAGGDRQTQLIQLREIEALVKQNCPQNEPIWRTLIGARNTDQSLLDVGLPFDKRWQVLIGSEIQDSGSLGYADQLLEFILFTIRGRTIFVTDQGVAGVSTPDIEEGDTIALIFGMGRPSVLREAEPQDLGIKIEMDSQNLCFHRITGFAYAGCHDRGGFEVLQKENLRDWRKHRCYQDREIIKFHII